MCGEGLRYPTPLEKTVHCEPGVVASVEWPLTIPNTPLVAEVVLETKHGNHLTKKTGYLNATPGVWEIARLTDIPMTLGQRLRGQDEAPYDHAATAALIDVSEDKLAGKRLNSIFMHPPYKGGVGYCFAKFDVNLPEGKPMLEFALGFREGSSTQDGCVFSVLVIESDKENEVFKEQYATLGAWAERSVDLSPYAGKAVTLKLVTDVGPADNSSSDWALWGAPRIVMNNVMKVEILDKRPQ